MKNLIIGSLMLLCSMSFANDKNSETSKKQINLTKSETSKKINDKVKPMCSVHYRDVWVSHADGSWSKMTVMIIIDCETGQVR